MGIVSMTLSVIHLCLGILAILFLIFKFPNDDKIPYSGFATKTAYRHCGLEPFIDKSLDRIKSCQLVYIGALFRHGTRAPSKKDVGNFRNLFNRLLSSKDALLPTGFSKCPIPFEHILEKSLLPRGYMEHQTLGQFYRDLLDLPSESSRFEFHTSSIMRAVLSAHSFYNGFFNLPPLDPSLFSHYDEKQSSAIPLITTTTTGAPIIVADHLIRFFDFCKRYINEIENNKSSVLEYTMFRNGPEMQQVLDELVSRHRLDKTLFTKDDLYTIYLACAFETAASLDDHTHSPWCEFLHSKQLPVLEYMVDLKQYWLKSYAYKLNYVQSCPLVSTLIDGLREAAELFHSTGFNISDPQLIRGSFWFGHAESLLPVIAALDLFNDSVGLSEPQHLRASDYEKWLFKAFANPSPPNMFRSGHIAPFAGNLELRLYHCSESAIMDQTESAYLTSDFFVQPLVNSRSVAWPLLTNKTSPTIGSTLIPLSTVLNYFNICAPSVYNDTAFCTV